MATRRPLTMIAGLLAELPLGDGTVSARRILTVPAATGAVTINWALYDEVRLTLVGNVALTFTGATDGQGCTLKLVQDATGSRLLTIGTNVRFSTDVPSLALTTTAGKRDRVGFIFDAPDGVYDFVSVIKGF